MSRKKNAHKLIDQAAEQATAFVDQAAVQATALVEQVTPHVEAARDRLVTEYVPQARKAGRRARKQMVEEYVPQARAAYEDARAPAEQAITAAAATTPLAKPDPKRPGRTVLKFVALVGIGVAVSKKLRSRDLSPVSMYEAPSPAPVAVPPQATESPVPPGAVGETDPAPEDVQRLDEETPVTPPEDSLNSFFDEVLNETKQSSRRR